MSELTEGTWVTFISALRPEFRTQLGLPEKRPPRPFG